MGTKATYLFLNSAKFWGGGEQWHLQCARALGERGHDVTVGGRKDGEFLKRIEQKGLPVLPLSLSSDWSFADRRVLRRWVDRYSPSAIFCNFTRDIRVAASVLKIKTNNRPRLLWVMGSILLKDTARHRRLVTEHVDSVIVPSQALKVELMEFGYVNDEIVHVIPNGIDLGEWPSPSDAEIANARNRFGVTSGDLVVGIYARLEQRKGQHVLLNAWQFIQSTVPQACLWIVGIGAADGELKAMVQRLGLRNIEFTGFEEQVRTRMLACDLIVQPSLYEPFGLTLLEAMACKKPVICTRVGGMPEVVDEGTTAELVAPDDPDGLSDAIVQLLRDGEKRSRLCTAGRQRVEQMFALDYMIDTLEEHLATQTTRAGRP